MLIGHWPLNGNTDDYSGFGNDATGYNLTYNTAGKIGQAGSFNGSSTYVRMDEAVPLMAGGDFSLAIWIKGPAQDHKGVMPINTASGDNRVLFLIRSAGMGIYDGTNWYIGTIDVDNDQWHHVCLTYNHASKNAKIYTDGVLDISVTTGNQITVASNDRLSLGQEWDGVSAPSDYFTGLMNDARAYNHELSLYEVKELAKAKILHYNFNDPYEEPTTNLIPNSPVNTYPTIGNSHGTLDSTQYNSNNSWSIGNVISVVDNIVTVDGTGRTIYTYDCIHADTSGGGVTAGTEYFVKMQGTNQFSLHAYNNSQDGSQGYINPTSGGHQVHYDVDMDNRISINATSFPTMWHSNPHKPNQGIVKEIIPNGFNYEGRKHDCIRIHKTFRGTDPTNAYMAYSVLPPVTAGEYYTFSFYARAVSVNAIGDSLRLTLYTGGGWSSGALGNYAYNMILTPQWQKYEMTALAPNSGGTIMYFPGVETYADIEISEIQCEHGISASPFAVSTRNTGTKDISGQEYNGTIVGNNISIVKESPILMSNSLRLYGLNDSYIYNTTIPETTDNLSYSCWLYQENGTVQHGTSTITRSFIMSHGRDVDPYGFNIVVLNGIIEAWYGSGIRLISGISAADGWHHVALTFDINVGAKLYVDGIEKASNVNTSISYANASGTFVIGKMSYGYTSSTYYFPFDGFISDVKIYATTLSTDDVKSLYERRANIDKAGNVQVNEINLPVSHLLVDEQTKNISDNTYRSMGTWNLIEIDHSDFVESDLTLGNTYVVGEVYLSSTTYYPTSFEFIRINNSQGFKTSFVNVSGGWKVGWNRVFFKAQGYSALESTPWNDMSRLETYRSGDATGTDTAQYITLRNIRLVKYLDNRDLSKEFNKKGQALFTDIDEVSGTSNPAASQEIRKDGTLVINGEFSEVD